MKRKGVGAKRTRHWFITAITFSALAGWPFVAVAEQPLRYQLADLEALETAFVGLAEKVRPSVVAIRTYRVRDPKSSSSKLVQRPHSQGSGFVLDGDGYIGTNRHVVDGADVISVILNNGEKLDAEVIQGDPRADLAVLKIDAEGLPPVEFGDLRDVKVNQWAFACGNPFGLANDDGRTSVTYGVVSALGRQMTQRLVGNSDIEYYGNMIETSSTINPGNSGGPLFDIRGRVIGIVAAIETSSGVSEGHGFAIPVTQNTRRILNTLKAGEEVRYGFVGVLVQDVDPPSSTLVVDSRVYRGAQLTRISFTNGPAANAGLRAKDIVLEYDGTPVESSDHFVRLVGFTPVGAEVPVTYLREGVKRKTTIVVGDRAELLGRNDRD